MVDPVRGAPTIAQTPDGEHRDNFADYSMPPDKSDCEQQITNS